MRVKTLKVHISALLIVLLLSLALAGCFDVTGQDNINNSSHSAVINTPGSTSTSDAGWPDTHSGFPYNSDNITYSNGPVNTPPASNTSAADGPNSTFHPSHPSASFNNITPPGQTGKEGSNTSLLPISTPTPSSTTVKGITTAPKPSATSTNTPAKSTTPTKTPATTTPKHSNTTNNPTPTPGKNEPIKIEYDFFELFGGIAPSKRPFIGYDEIIKRHKDNINPQGTFMQYQAWALYMMMYDYVNEIYKGLLFDYRNKDNLNSYMYWRHGPQGYLPEGEAYKNQILRHEAIHRFISMYKLKLEIIPEDIPFEYLSFNDAGLCIYQNVKFRVTSDLNVVFTKNNIELNKWYEATFAYEIVMTSRSEEEMKFDAPPIVKDNKWHVYYWTGYNIQEIK